MCVCIVPQSSPHPPKPLAFLLVVVHPSQAKAAGCMKCAVTTPPLRPPPSPSLQSATAASAAIVTSLWHAPRWQQGIRNTSPVGSFAHQCIARSSDRDRAGCTLRPQLQQYRYATAISAAAAAAAAVAAAVAATATVAAAVAQAAAAASCGPEDGAGDARARAIRAGLAVTLRSTVCPSPLGGWRIPSLLSPPSL